MSTPADPHVLPRRLVALGLTTAIAGSSAPIPLYPIYRATLGLDAFTMTIIFVVYIVGVLIALFSASRLLDFLRNSHRLLAPALVLVIIAALTLGTADSLAALITGRLLAGIGTGCVTVAANAALVNLAPGRDPRHAGVVAGLAFSSGSGLGPIVTGAALQWNIWPLTLPFILVATSAVVALIAPISRWNVSSPEHKRRQNAGKQSPATTPPKQIPWPPVLLCLAVIFTNWGLGATLMALGPYIGDVIFGISSYALTGYAVSAYMIISASSQWLHRRVSLRPALLRGSILITSGATLIVLGGLLQSAPLAALGMFTSGAGGGAVFGSAAALINQVSPPEHRSRLVSLFFAAGYTGSLLPMGLGAMTDAWGALPTMIAYTAMVGSVFIVIATKVKGLGPQRATQ